MRSCEYRLGVGQIQIALRERDPTFRLVPRIYISRIYI
jgi:hypothetical protein